MADKSIGEHQFLWQIENFSACTEDTTYYICSPVIRARDLDHTLWNILLAPRGDEDDGFISVHLVRSEDDDGPSDLPLDLEFCLVDFEGEERFEQCASFICKQGTSFPMFVRRSDVFEDKDTLLPNDVLTLLIRARRSKNGKFSATRSVVRTKIHVERSSFEWTIRGLTRKASSNSRVIRIESGAAPSGMELTCECGNAVDERTPGKGHVLRFAIKLKDTPDVRIFMSITIQALDSRIKPHTKLETEHFFEAGSNDTWHLPSFDISNRLESLPEEDSLDLACDLSISDGSEDRRKEGTLIPLADSFHLEGNTLLQDVRFAYESTFNITPDILLDVRNGMQHFQAHKFILSARSRVFRDTLNSFDVKKKRWFELSNANIPTIRNSVCVRHENMTVYVKKGMDHVQILHTSPYILAQILKCMYTDTLNPDNVINATQLYSAGVRFDFRLLREKSEKYLKSKISLRSFYSILEFAHLTGVVRLKRECLDFISKNRGFILASNEWVDLRERHEDLAQEISDILKSERK